jgi:hypothetical protein
MSLKGANFNNLGVFRVCASNTPGLFEFAPFGDIIILLILSTHYCDEAKKSKLAVL